MSGREKRDAPFMRCVSALAVSAGVAVYFLVKWMPPSYTEPWLDPDDANGGGFGFVINSRERFIFGIIFTVVQTLFDGYIRGRTGRWRSFYVNNPSMPRAEIPSSDLKIYATLVCYNLYSAFTYLVQIFFSFTNIYIFSARQISSIGVSIYNTRVYLNDKEPFSAKSSKDDGCTDRMHLLGRLGGGDEDPLVVSGSTNWGVNLPRGALTSRQSTLLLS